MERSNICYGGGMATHLTYNESTGNVTAVTNEAAWVINVDWVLRDGIHEPCAVTIAMKDPHSQAPRARLTATNIRQLPIAEAIKLTRDQRAIRASTERQYWELVDEKNHLDNAFNDGGGRRDAELFWSITDELERLEELRDTPVGPQRGSAITDSSLQEVAKAYMRAIERGLPVTEAVATQCRVSKSTAGKRIMKARQRGYLPPVGEKQ